MSEMSSLTISQCLVFASAMFFEKCLMTAELLSSKIVLRGNEISFAFLNMLGVPNKATVSSGFVISRHLSSKYEVADSLNRQS